jgi:glycosyltransferase involved in cell wall biosynthesis
VSHPIQYQAPLLRRIAQEPDIELTVFFGSDFSVKGYKDEGFGVDVAWDIPLLEGYNYHFLPALRDTGQTSVTSPISRGLLKALRGEDGNPLFDVLWVHGYSTINQIQGILLAKLVGIPVLLRSDSSLRDRPRGLLKQIAKRAFFAVLRNLVDGVLVCGTWNRDYWRYYLGESFPFFMLPYAVDNEWFQRQCDAARSRRSELLAELALDPTRPVILYASKLQTRKLCRDLLDAYTRLANNPGQTPIPYLVIVGDGEERAALEEQAKETGLDSIRFCGFRNQSELPRFYELCSVFVLPARHEPWGLVVNEVMNAARPVILSNDVGCAVDLVTNGVEGYIYPVQNIDALERALRLVLDSPERTTVMGKNAFHKINGWNFEADVRGLLEAIQHLTGNRRIDPLVSFNPKN